ncbi:PrpF domain-containing protein [Fusibacter ferrireducens]|uniref:3-methylitaconate isomerase n=1 Tax=Fusibacter ferrireducens TaxID=2785058 RepID=A0ABR9ZNW8_9FIRM|nr:PrpF domain-containing protein [Fusibacter ferrireducens]MBF4692129.1 3-methylitaconate isomerase [Fusibacter ferrireducens]
MNQTKCTIMRGGTSKGIFFRVEDMPKDKSHWNDFLLDVMGSPDARQIDGLGGANSLTSKVAIIGKSPLEGIDIDYTFAQVSIKNTTVDLRGNCGNILSAVGPYAVDKGLIENVQPITKVMVRNTNTNKLFSVNVPVCQGKVVSTGDYQIQGVPGYGAPIDIDFHHPFGAVTGKLLPTDLTKNMISTTLGNIEISIVDSGNPLVFVKSKSIGIRDEDIFEPLSDDKLNILEEIRSIACELCGFASKERATAESPAVPKMTIIAQSDHFNGSQQVNSDTPQANIAVRMMSMQKPHQALAITGAVCTATAALLPETLVFDTISALQDGVINIVHPSGIMPVYYTLSDDDTIDVISVKRTARKIMDGIVYTKRSY